MPADIRGRATGTAGGASLTPGQHLRAELRRLELDQVAAGRALGVTRQTINNIVNDRFPISRATASKLGQLTGHRADYWLRSVFPADHSAMEPKSEPSVAETGGHVLASQQILRALQEGVIRIEPFAESQLRPASVDLTLDRQAMTLSGESIDLGGKYGFRLKSGRAVKVHTREHIELPPNYLGRAGAAERLAVCGVVAMHALQIDPGFRGKLHFCLFNASEREFAMRPGDPVLCIEIMPLAVAPATAHADISPSARRKRAK